MTREGINAAIAPEINEPKRTKGMPSKTSARNENQKFCQLNANQVIALHNLDREKTEASFPGRYRIGSRIQTPLNSNAKGLLSVAFAWDTVR
jgi:hypothetical protein